MVNELVAGGSRYCGRRLLEEAERCAHICCSIAVGCCTRGAAQLSERVRGACSGAASPRKARQTAESELERDAVLDAVIQVRACAWCEARQCGRIPRDAYEPVAPRLEDAYIELLAARARAKACWRAAGRRGRAGTRRLPQCPAGRRRAGACAGLTRRFGTSWRR